MSYFVHIPDLEVERYTNYFLNDFIPSRDFENQVSNKKYIPYYVKDFYKDSTISKLDFELQSKFNFPRIEYFFIFKHTIDQTIHTDGIKIPRYASLNLPLKGFESTKMLFYMQKNNVTPKINDATYYKPEQVYPVAELLGSNQWVLVDTSIPHNIANIDSNNPRYTVCIRFCTNPSFLELVNRMNGPGYRNRTCIDCLEGSCIIHYTNPR
jgi:hypothetical protein